MGVGQKRKVDPVTAHEMGIADPGQGRGHESEWIGVLDTTIGAIAGIADLGGWPRVDDTIGPLQRECGTFVANFDPNGNIQSLTSLPVVWRNARADDPPGKPRLP